MKRKLFTLLAAAALGGVFTQGAAAQQVPLGRVSSAETATAQRHADKARAAMALEMVPRLKAGSLTGHGFPQTRPYVAPVAVPMQANGKITSADAQKIYGGAIYADTWTSDYQPVGIYAFDKTDGSTLQPVKVGEDYVVTGGGCFANGKYYYTSYMSFMGMIMAQMYVVNFETWEIERDAYVETGAVAQDMAYDPTTGNAYGCFMNDDGDGWVFGFLNLETGKRTRLKDLDLIILSVGVSSQGDVYGVGLDGVFYKFDKRTGDRTAIGATGRRPSYSASGCFDLATDTFYWECMEADAKARLYTIDLETGAATYVTDIAQNMEMTGMFIPVPEAEDDAPAAVADLGIDFAGEALSGYVTFTMPTMTFASEKSLTGELTYTLSVNEEEHTTATAAAGEAVRVPLTVAAPDSYRLSVTVSNSVGKSPLSQVEKWIGADVPDAVTDVKLTRNVRNGMMTLTWTAPAESVHGGYYDMGDVKYTVRRFPGNVEVAKDIAQTTFTETVEDGEGFDLYYYTVTPSFKGYSGATSESNKVGVGVQPLPYFNAIDSDDDFANLTVEDTNGDEETWIFDIIRNSARCKYSAANSYKEPMNDWLFTPAVRLSADRMYRFSARISSHRSIGTERAEIGFGNLPESAAMTVIAGPKDIKTADGIIMEGYVNVPAEGKYYFGVHGCSRADQLYLYADDLRIEEGPLLGTPGAVTDLSITPAAQGKLETSISFKAPTKTVEGTDLTAVSSITIKRNGKLVTTIENPAPGAEVKYTDSQAEQSDNVYVITAVNDNGEGYSVSKTVYVGHDRPGLPVNVTAHEQDGKVVITWEAPTKSETGGYFDPSALTYTVLRANDEAELATGLTAMTFTDDNPPLGGYRQEFFQYYVYAQSPAGYGYGQASNTVTVGTPYELPFIESFPDGRLNCDPWDVRIPEGSSGTWSITHEGQTPTAPPYDNDGGLVTFKCQEEGDSGTLVSSKIDLGNAESPVVEFRWFATKLEDCRIYVDVIVADGEMQRIGTVNYEDAPSEGWQKAQFSLDAYAGAGLPIQVAFTAKCPEGVAFVHIDNIMVKENYDYNLAVTGFNVPSRMMVGELSKIRVQVENRGKKTAKDFSVELYRDGKLEQTLEGVTTLPDGVREYVFDVTPSNTWSDNVNWHAKVVYANDQYDGDNTSAAMETRLNRPNYPAIHDLDGTAVDGKDIRLTWSEPTIGTAGGERQTETVDNYAQFSIDNFGEWTVRDADKGTTVGIASPTGSSLQYPNAGGAMAFMAFNPSAAGIPVEDESGKPTDWTPHSGDQVFASFCSNTGKNDDWLISPLLPGIEQEISFWVKSLTADYGFERYEVYYSTTGIEPADFQIIGGLRSAPVQWYEEKVTLPEGARYFAIRCVSEDAYIFMVDDISFYASDSYTGELSLMGYNVYRDDVCLTAEPIMELEYTDTPDDTAFHNYAVTVVYDKGESAYSNILRISTLAVDGISADSVSVTGGHGNIVIAGAADMQVAVYAADGRTVTSFTGTGRDEVSVAAGVYVVSAGKKSCKVIVR